MCILEVRSSVALRWSELFEVEGIIVDSDSVSAMKCLSIQPKKYLLPDMSCTMTPESPKISAIFSGSSTCLYLSSFFRITSCIDSPTSFRMSSRNLTFPFRVDIPNTWRSKLVHKVTHVLYVIKPFQRSRAASSSTNSRTTLP